jgi:hypothetical protein
MENELGAARLEIDVLKPVKNSNCNSLIGEKQKLSLDVDTKPLLCLGSWFRSTTEQQIC